MVFSSENNKLKNRLGILGGMGPKASEVLYRWITDRTDASCDQDHIPIVIISDTQMPDRTESILSGNTSGIYSQLLSDCRQLEACGCACIAIACNTSHYFVENLQKEVEIPIFNMPARTVERLADSGKKKVAVLATDGTLKTGIYTRELEKRGISYYRPEGEIQAAVMSIIYDDIKEGKPGSMETWQKIEAAIRREGCDSAILGCTELSVFRENYDLPDFYLDAMEVLVDDCLNFFGKAKA